MTKTHGWFGISNLGHGDLFVICNLGFVISNLPFILIKNLIIRLCRPVLNLPALQQVVINHNLFRVFDGFGSPTIPVF